MMEHKNTRLTVKAVSEKGTFEGYGSVFGNVDLGGDIVVKGAFSESLDRHKEQGTMPALLWQHDHQEPIGVWEEMAEDDHGLYVRGRLLVEDDPLARRAHAHLKAGSLSGLSIGFSTLDDETNKDGTRNIKQVDLWETSLVTFPMNESARVAGVKQRDFIHNIRDFEDVLRRCGFTRREAKAIAAEGWMAVHRDDVEPEGMAQLLKALQV